MDPGAHWGQRMDWERRKLGWPGAAPARLPPIPERLQGPDGIGESGDGAQDSAWSWAAPCPRFPEPGWAQGPGRSRTRPRVHGSAAATRAGLGDVPAVPGASQAQSLAQTLPSPQNKPPVLTQHPSQRAKRTQQTPGAPSPRCHLACSSQQTPARLRGCGEKEL